MDVDDRIIVFLLEGIETSVKEVQRFIDKRYPDDLTLEEAVKNNVAMIGDIARDTLKAIHDRHKDKTDA